MHDLCMDIPHATGGIVRRSDGPDSALFRRSLYENEAVKNVHNILLAVSLHGYGSSRTG